ncbi:helix-turn-helix domain-containing protein [Tepidibacter formicigenes]|jgi:transcriptional regulator with XRE-family HTH domain|uniref:Transcriptional regulator, contains XRE-family HTH domain n=1 Tax=Tepidibacter formicigenes DSM 15518 TaxID=1123349 RepID=A0A1M6SMB1_9FIRM|nr:helix-turn-helix transcriptional regulator [Tepidibacter formicigenes]SHK45776.1 Transcriptional regulator, contains XRE-family HTH domain [Tepidibacter formicigenes DSM 15518]
MNTIDFISKRITDLRLKKNVSSRKMSLDLGLSNSYITQIENGKKSPSIDNLYKICDYFGITIVEFFLPQAPLKQDFDLTEDLKELVESAKDLSPSQLEALKIVSKAFNERR